MKTYFPIILVTLVAIAFRVWFWSYTQYTAEDAHITFQFAKRISEGYGFVYNRGQPIYGTTTPLLTFLLAGWSKISSDMILGSKLIALVSSVTGLWFLYFSIENKTIAFLSTFTLAVSLKLIYEEMDGMEMSLLFLFMMGAIYFYSKDNMLFAGIMSAFLLFTRIDSVIFVACIFAWIVLQKGDWKGFLVGSALYIPWLAFSQYYFGSFIPFTIIAKQVAYGSPAAPFMVSLGRIVQYVSYALLATFALSIFRIPFRFQFLNLFILLNILVICFTGTSFFNRYFYMITVIMIITGCLSLFDLNKVMLNMIVMACIVYGIIDWDTRPTYFKDLQVTRMDVLENMGIWMNQNTPENSTILLEPLGYAGYYADRNMLDEVGLITPSVVDLKRKGVGGNKLYSFLWPDYVVYQCHQGDATMDDFSKHYQLIKVFDNGYQRSCYEIWMKYGQ